MYFNYNYTRAMINIIHEPKIEIREHTQKSVKKFFYTQLLKMETGGIEQWE